MHTGLQVITRGHTFNPVMCNDAHTKNIGVPNSNPLSHSYAHLCLIQAQQSPPILVAKKSSSGPWSGTHPPAMLAMHMLSIGKLAIGVEYQQSADSQLWHETGETGVVIAITFSTEYGYNLSYQLSGQLASWPQNSDIMAS